MKKLNQKYFTVAVYALAVIAFSIIFLLFCINLGVISSAVVSFLSAIGSLLYAILFAFLLFPAIKRFDSFYEKLFSKKKPRPHLASAFSIATTLLLALGALAALLIGIIPRLIIDAGELYRYVMHLKGELDLFMEQSAASQPLIADLYRALTDFLFGAQNGVSSLLSGLVSSLTGILSAIIGQVSNIFLGLIISIYLLASRRVISGILGKLVVAILPEKHVNRFVLFFKRLYTDFASFSFNRLVIAFFFSAAVFFLCLIMRVPLLSIVVLLVLLSHLIPVIGPIIGTSLSIALVFILKGPWGFLYAAIILVLEVFSTNVVLPHMLPKKLRPPYGITAGMVLLSLALFGVIGAFVAVPLYATLNVEIRRILVHRLAKKNLPLSSEAYANFNSDMYAAALPAEDTPMENGTAEDGGEHSETD